MRALGNISITWQDTSVVWCLLQIIANQNDGIEARAWSISLFSSPAIYTYCNSSHVGQFIVSCLWGHLVSHYRFVRFPWIWAHLCQYSIFINDQLFAFSQHLCVWLSFLRNVWCSQWTSGLVRVSLGQSSKDLCFEPWHALLGFPAAPVIEGAS